MLEFMRQQLKALQDKRAALKAELDGVLAAPTAEKRDLTTEESTAFDTKRAEVLKADEDITAAETRIAELEAIEGRSAKAAEVRAKQGPAVTVGAEPMIYGEGSGHSYFLDMVRNDMNRGDGDGGVDAARQRLQRHAQELKVEMPARITRQNQRAEADIAGVPHRRAGVSPFERRVNPNRTDGTGGYFVPPLWLVDQYVELPRFGRTIANSVRNLTLPSGTDSINLPKVATGTATGVQTADAAAVTSTDMTDSTVSAPVRTIAGQQDIAIQLLDQSPVSFDEIVYSDLIMDYNQKLDIQVINGSGSNGQVTGILNVSGINAITYTDASPTLPEMYVPWVKSASQIATNRTLPALATFCTPAIWYAGVSDLDTTNRPLILTEPGGAFNPMALQTGDGGEGFVGRLSFGLPVLIDGNIPSNLGGTTTESRVITARTSDLYLWEGSMRTRTLTEILSGTLQVRVQVYGYVAFMADRLPKAISVMSGTGCIPRAGF